ncbi:hypothetical protein [Cypionkella sp.]|uniref:hypothetical protein n=1 Tax=Cypionkella sp. TaxID=2811411 RepID=UPI0026358C96|nr:hypothetical protein [Cypionkella sp.]
MTHNRQRIEGRTTGELTTSATVEIKKGGLRLRPFFSSLIFDGYTVTLGCCARKFFMYLETVIYPDRALNFPALPARFAPWRVFYAVRDH